MTEPRRLIEVCTFEAVDGMIIDDLARLIREAEVAAKAARVAAEAQPKLLAAELNRPVMRWRLGGLAGGWFR